MRRLMPLLAAATLVLSTGETQARGQWQQTHKLTAVDAEASDGFGISVSISGGIAIVGAPGDNDAGTGSGSAYLFNVATGQQLHKLTADDGAAFDVFGVSVGISGGIAIIGARADDDAGESSGSAYLFDVTTGLQLHKLTAEDAAEIDFFGNNVSISGGIAIVGAQGDDDAGSSSGSVYLFDVATGQQLHKLTADDAAEGDSFGNSVGISGDVAIVGVKRDDDAGSDSGSAYLFDVATGQQLHKLTADDAAEDDGFGNSVGINGGIAIVGARADDDAGDSSGSAYLFDVATGQQLHKLTADDAAAGDELGGSVGLSGGIAIVGAPGTGLGSGSAYVFEEGDLCAADDGDGMVTICHLPPGNPDNAHTIRVSVNAVPAHLAHGDHCGPCEEGDGLLVRSGGDAGHDLCPTDLDDSGDVGAADLAEFLGAWGTNPGHPADFDGDGEVGPLDLALVLGNWGPCP